MSVIYEIAAERKRQLKAEGWTNDHDDAEHEDGGLAQAAGCYALFCNRLEGDKAPDLWPWDETDWKPRTRRRNLIRAAALIVAEIERLDRAASTPQEKECGMVCCRH